MNWSYKTVRFDMKKEGILGSAFLDELEIETSLNEFGKVGWELVSFIEIQEGLLAVFKMLTGRVKDSPGKPYLEKINSSEPQNTPIDNCGLEIQHKSGDVGDTDLGAIRIE